MTELAIARRAAQVRAAIVRASHATGTPFAGPSMSVVDIMTVLHDQFLRESAAGRVGRDRLVLGRGPAVVALLATLVEFGARPAAELAAYCRHGALAADPMGLVGVGGVEVLFGSPGNSLAIAVGIALATQTEAKGMVFAILGAGEGAAGATWEAAELAARQQLDRLVVVLDASRHHAASGLVSAPRIPSQRGLRPQPKSPRPWIGRNSFRMP